MRTDLHAVNPEELMEYLDGELTADQAARVSTHMAGCLECQTAAAEMRHLSETLREWTVETPDIFPPEGNVRKAALGFTWGKLGWSAAAFAGVAFMSLLFLRSTMQMNVKGPMVFTNSQVAHQGGPLIARSGSLTLRVHDFDHVREVIDQILLAHQGYVAQMTMNATEGAARSIVGRVRVPAGELEPTFAALERLGTVQSETRSGEEVTKESMDLDARLTNARNTEQRLTTLLKDRTGKLSDVLAVEEKIDAVRLEIEHLEAERKALSTRVEFATIELRVKEEYKAQLEGVNIPVWTRLRAAGRAGISAVTESLILATSFLLAAGPVGIVWIAILFFPARFAWRRWRNSL